MMASPSDSELRIELIDALAKTAHGFHSSQLEVVMALIKRESDKRELKIINYVLSEPTGKQTMTTIGMSEIADETWRDTVISYFFNTTSLQFNLTRRKEKLKAELSEGGA